MPPPKRFCFNPFDARLCSLFGTWIVNCWIKTVQRMQSRTGSVTADACTVTCTHPCWTRFVTLILTPMQWLKMDKPAPYLWAANHWWPTKIKASGCHTNGKMRFSKKMISLWTAFLVGSLCCCEIEGHPSGAGRTACDTLQPDHKEAPDPSKYASPYSVQVADDTRIYKPGEKLTGRKHFLTRRTVFKLFCLFWNQVKPACMKGTTVKPVVFLTHFSLQVPVFCLSLSQCVSLCLSCLSACLSLSLSLSRARVYTSTRFSFDAYPFFMQSLSLPPAYHGRGSSCKRESRTELELWVILMFPPRKVTPEPWSAMLLTTP